MFESVQARGLQARSRRADRHKADRQLYIAVTDPGGYSSTESANTINAVSHRKLTDSYTSMKSRFRDSAADLKRRHTVTSPRSSAGERREFSSLWRPPVARTPSSEAENSLKRRFACPEDVDLQKLSQLGTGWCSCAPPSSDPKTAGLGSTLQESEWKSIRHALAKAEKCDKMEQRRIGRLVKDVEQLKLQRKARNAVPNQCHDCGFMFTGLAWLLSIGYTTCAGCTECFCQNSTCLVAIKSRSGNIRMVCRLCSKLLDVWTKSGVWFYKTLPSYDAADDETISRLTPMLLEMKPRHDAAPSAPEPKQTLRHTVSLGILRSANGEGMSGQASHDGGRGSVGGRHRPVRRQRINKLYESPPDLTCIGENNPPQRSTINVQDESDSSQHDDRHPLGANRRVSGLDQLGLRSGAHLGTDLHTRMDARSQSLSPRTSNATRMVSPALTAAATPAAAAAAAAAAVDAAAADAAVQDDGGVVLPSVTCEPVTPSGQRPRLQSFRKKAHSMSGTCVLKDQAERDKPDLRKAESHRAFSFDRRRESKLYKSLPASAIRALISQSRKASHPTAGLSLDSDEVDLAAVVLDACLPPPPRQKQQQQPHHQHLGAGEISIDEAMEMRDVVSGEGVRRRQSKFKNTLSPKKQINGQTEAYLGSIEFTVLYNSQEQELNVTIVGCKDLIAMDFHGASDPFVRLKLLPYHRKSSRSTKYDTSVKKRTLNPEYNEVFTYHGIEQSDVRYLILRLIVYDHDTLTANDFLGEVIFRMKDVHPNMLLNYNRLLETSSQLRRESVDFSSMHVSNSDLGKLLVSICYKPEEGQLCVGIVRAAGLPALDRFSKQCDPYVKCYLLPDPSKSSKRRTAILKRTANPEFNEKFSYNVDTRALMSSTLEISVWDSNYAHRNKLIGCLQLSSTCGPEVSQWLDAMCTPNEQFTVWHKLKPRRRVNAKIKVTEL